MVWNDAAQLRLQKLALLQAHDNVCCHYFDTCNSAIGLASHISFGNLEGRQEA